MSSPSCMAPTPQDSLFPWKTTTTTNTTTSSSPSFSSATSWANEATLTASNVSNLQQHLSSSSHQPQSPSQPGGAVVKRPALDPVSYNPSSSSSSLLQDLFQGPPSTSATFAAATDDAAPPTTNSFSSHSNAVSSTPPTSLLLAPHPPRSTTTAPTVLLERRQPSPSWGASAAATPPTHNTNTSTTVSLYSAIGSLEDSTGTSFEWNPHWRYHRQQQQQRQSSTTTTQNTRTASSTSTTTTTLSTTTTRPSLSSRLPIPKPYQMPPGLLLVPLSTLQTQKQQQQQKQQQPSQEPQPVPPPKVSAPHESVTTTTTSSIPFQPPTSLIVAQPQQQLPPTGRIASDNKSSETMTTTAGTRRLHQGSLFDTTTPTLEPPLHQEPNQPLSVDKDDDSKPPTAAPPVRPDDTLLPLQPQEEEGNSAHKTTAKGERQDPSKPLTGSTNTSRTTQRRVQIQHEPVIVHPPQEENDEGKGTSSTTTTTTSRRTKSAASSSTLTANAPIVELFRPSSDAYTPRIRPHKSLKYKPAAQRTPVPHHTTAGGTLVRPNFRHALRRVALILHQHILKIEVRFANKSRAAAAAAASQRRQSTHSLGRTTPNSSPKSNLVNGRNAPNSNHSKTSPLQQPARPRRRPRQSQSTKPRTTATVVPPPPQTDSLFKSCMEKAFHEDAFLTPTYTCTMVRVPMARSGLVMAQKRIRPTYEIPSEEEIYNFAHRLFQTVQLSSECSIVCLIYVERLMEQGKVPLLATTWRPIVLTGLLLASKVWQDWSSWNIEFTHVYPQYSLQAISCLECQFLRILKWDLYITSSLYAKYYFALRALVEEKTDFRQRYNRLVGGVGQVQAGEALKVQERSSRIKAEALLQLSRSM